MDESSQNIYIASENVESECNGENLDTDFQGDSEGDSGDVDLDKEI